jgi:HAD superfamily hydrolase (TIGR01509 family)
MAFIAVLQKLGIKADSDPHIPGVSLKSNWQEILVRYKIQTDKTPEELETLTYLEYEKLIPQITLNDGVLEFMDTLKESGLPLSLATSTNWQITDKILERFGLNDFFENITTGEEVINAKPAPDIFLTASEKLGVEPIDCLVFEDSPSGVTAAHDAGMKVIVVLGDGENKGKLDMADLVTGSFSEITLKAIDAISQY